MCKCHKNEIQVRHSCLECVEKHLGAAFVLIGEVLNGYPHRLLAIGHLHEAEEESFAWPILKAKIRHARRQYQNYNRAPDWHALDALIRSIDQTRHGRPIDNRPDFDI
jgi:hypothetical protein